MTTIHRGRLLGRLKASRIPVRIALPSSMVTLSLPSIYLVMAHSKRTQLAMLVSSTTAAPRPKKYRLHTNAGSRAIHTPYMFLWTVSPLWT